MTIELVGPFNIYAAAAGQHEDTVRTMNKFGRNAAAAATEGIWMPSSVFPGMDTITPGVATVSSSSDADNKTTATGALTMKLFGLSVDKSEFVSEIVTLDGSDAVLTTQTFSRIYRAKVLTAGSGDENAGNITITVGGVTVAYVAIGRNQTEQAWFTVPKGWVGLISKIRASFANTSATRSADIDLACSASEDSNIVTPLYTLSMVTVGSGAVEETFDPPIMVPPGIDVMLVVRQVSAESEIHGSFDMLLVKG